MIFTYFLLRCREIFNESFSKNVHEISMLAWS